LREIKEKKKRAFSTKRTVVFFFKKKKRLPKKPDPKIFPPFTEENRPKK